MKHIEEKENKEVVTSSEKNQAEDLGYSPFSDGKPEEISYSGKTFKRFRNRSQIRLGREAIIVNVDNNGYLSQKNSSQDRWVNCERWELSDDAIFQISSPVFEWLFGRDDLRFLYALDVDGYLAMLLEQNNPGELMALNLEEIKNGKLNDKNINDYTLEELNDLADHGSTTINLEGLFALLHERTEFTYDDITQFVPNNLQDYVRSIFAQYNPNVEEIEVWKSKFLTPLAVTLCIFMIGASINLKDLEDQIRRYVEFLLTGFSLRHRKRGFEDQYFYTHKGGDPAFTRGRFMKYTEREAIPSINMEKGRILLPMMFKLDEKYIGNDHLNIPAAYLNLSATRNLIGNLLDVAIGGLVNRGHLYKANGFNSYDIDTTGQNETASRDTFRIYIED